ncbi:inorganic diphosphatase [Dyadobacter flavalbus]|uniref:inorganic diphosphatase n=1 Tax=Dyadobacter flavalbus TaxID=2579942 RepID=A0A5M8QS61_9BACT|nr:inorganic diphosphatase [Dyadobacter flavalbus]KAA6437022.1 inorganic diphosphatase [Dyadobacter flavalbus]
MSNITAIIESPKGSGQKYDFDPEMKLFKLVKILPAGMVFPFDFGFIPDTLGEDGDPLDIVVISEFRSFPGCAMECRIVGAIKAFQTERNGEKMRNDRFLGVPVVSELFRDVTSVDQLPERIIEQLRNFFKNYNEQAGKEFDPFETITSEESIKLIAKQKN